MLEHKIAIYGANGYQIHNELLNYPKGELCLWAAIELEEAEYPGGYQVGTLDEIVKVPQIELISLFSPDIALSILAELTNHAPVTIDLNYLNVRTDETWGYDELQFFGRLGILESLDGGRVCRLKKINGKTEIIVPDEPHVDWLDCFLDEIEKKMSFPLSQREKFPPDYFLYALERQQILQ